MDDKTASQAVPPDATVKQVVSTDSNTDDNLSMAMVVSTDSNTDDNLSMAMLLAKAKNSMDEKGANESMEAIIHCLLHGSNVEGEREDVCELLVGYLTKTSKPLTVLQGLNVLLSLDVRLQEIMVEKKALVPLKEILLGYFDVFETKEACVVVSKIIDGNERCMKAALDDDIMDALSVLIEDEYDGEVTIEACKAISMALCAAMEGRNHNLICGLNEYCVPALTSVSRYDGHDYQEVCLEGYCKILGCYTFKMANRADEEASKIGATEPFYNEEYAKDFLSAFLEIFGAVEELLNSDFEDIYETAWKALDNFFSKCDRGTFQTARSGHQHASKT